MRSRAIVNPIHRRRFDRIDATVLVAASALGLEWAREYHELALSIDSGYRGLRLWRPTLVPLFACWTLALLPLWARRPRPRIRLLARRPGFATVLVASLQAIRCLADLPIWLTFNHRKLGQELDLLALVDVLSVFPNRLVTIGDGAGFAVAATWFALAWARWWRPDPGWIDRAGRVLCWSWIALFAASCYERAAG